MLSYIASTFLIESACNTRNMFARKTRKLITDRSKAEVFLWFSVACFGVSVSVTFHLRFVHISFISVWVAEWPPFGKGQLIRLTICSLCILNIFSILVISRFGFEEGFRVLFAAVPGHCILVALSTYL